MPRTVLVGIFAASAVVGGACVASAATTPINLNTWSQQGASGNGTWNVTADGSSVRQTINGQPTFFVSPDDYINTTIRGTFNVGSSSDDDFIGFVFGFQSPMATSGSAAQEHDYYLFDWKKYNQTDAGFLGQEGFTLSRVDGTVPTGDISSVFWGHTGSAITVLGSDYGTNRGWRNHIEYTFELIFQTNLIEIVIDGGAFDNETIFSLAGSFSAGKFGFYNYSQNNVTYTSFTEEDTPVVPSPAAFAGGSALMGLLFGAGAMRRRRA